jgi:hypothetical protein
MENSFLILDEYIMGSLEKGRGKRAESRYFGGGRREGVGLGALREGRVL